MGGEKNLVFKNDDSLGILHKKLNENLELSNNLLSGLSGDEEEIKINKSQISGLHSKISNLSDQLSLLKTKIERPRNEHKEFEQRLKHVIAAQKEELEQKEAVLTKYKTNHEELQSRVNNLLESKRVGALKIKELTKEASNYYGKKIKEYKAYEEENKKIKKQLGSQKKVFEKAYLEDVKSLKEELGKNNDSLFKLKQILKLQKEESDKKEALIKELLDEADSLRREAQSNAKKAMMYEKISLESKNDSLAAAEQTRILSDELKEEKQINKEAKIVLPEIEAELGIKKKQLKILEEEYEKRISRVKEKHENEIREQITSQLKEETILKSQVYALTRNVDELETTLALNKKKQQEVFLSLNDKLKTFLSPLVEQAREGSLVFQNKPESSKKIRENYALYDQE
ncbi:hypothetical protein GOV05_04410 [Candidatus Woesearchaeota archaeon]|nr:hypothetical protein [Candidatus Woesearchaeota archaeon]